MQDKAKIVLHCFILALNELTYEVIYTAATLNVTSTLSVALDVKCRHQRF